MYIQVENPRTNVEAVPNRKRQTENDNSHWYFVRQKLLMFKNGESHPDKANLMLTIAQSQKEADEVIPFKEGFYVVNHHRKVDHKRHPKVDHLKQKIILIFAHF